MSAESCLPNVLSVIKWPDLVAIRPLRRWRLRRAVDLDRGVRRARERRNDSRVESVREVPLSESDTLVCFVAELLLDELDFRDSWLASLSIWRIKTAAAATTTARSATAPPTMPPSCVVERLPLPWPSLPSVSAGGVYFGTVVADEPVVWVPSPLLVRSSNEPKLVGTLGLLTMIAVVVIVVIVPLAVVVMAVVTVVVIGWAG